MSRTAAFFDVDGTLVAKNIVHHYFYIRRRMLPWPVRSVWSGYFLAKTPFYFVLDKFSRTRLNVVFYRNYAGLKSESVKSLARACFRDVIRPHLFAEAAECIADHRRERRRIILVTGSIDFLIEPLARLLKADDVVAPTLLECDGRFTGDLDGPPVGAKEKARRIRDYATRTDIDLAASFGYGDHIADLAMLQAVGHPHAVNPDRALAHTARRMGWPTLRWSVGKGRGNGR